MALAALLKKPGLLLREYQMVLLLFADVDGNQTQDVVITGEAASGSIARLYLNDGMGNFTEQTGTPFEGISNSSIAFADADGNQAIDLLLTGNTGLEFITKLYLNEWFG
ncbi:MAG: VCBS repeat-containing protein [Bacteroidia bacterium]